MKKYKVYTTILIILILLVLTALGLYIFKKDTVKSWLNLKEANVVTQEPKVEEPKKEETPTRIDKIITLGTGMKRPSNYKPTDSYCIYEYKYELEDLVNNLNNVQLKNEINTFIKESKTKLTKDEVEFKKYIDEGNKLKGSIIDQDNNKYNYYVPQVKEYYNGYMSYSDNQENDIGIITDWKCVNGYGEIYGNVMGKEVRSYGIYKSYCATYDLYTGKKIQLSDLFFEGEDYSTELYELMQSKMSVGGYGNYIKRDFSTLEKNYEKFTLNSIFFDKQNTVFSEGAIIPTEYYYTI